SPGDRAVMCSVAAWSADSGRTSRTRRSDVPLRNFRRRAIRAATAYGSPAAFGSCPIPTARDQGIALYTLVLGRIHSRGSNSPSPQLISPLPGPLRRWRANRGLGGGGCVA